MKRILLFTIVFIFAAAAFVVCASAAVEDEHVAKAIYGTPDIDGTLDYIWTTAQIHTLTNVASNDEITPPSTIEFRVMYDSNYLYFYVEVNDSTMGTAEWEMTNNSWYNKDGVAFVFSPDNNRDETTTQVAPAFWYIIRAFGTTANYNQVDSKIFISEDDDPTAANATKMFTVVQKTDASGNYTGYVLECKVNLKVRYPDFKAEAGTKIGFDMFLNDNNYFLMSTSRNYMLTWTPSVNSYKNNAIKGIIELCIEGEFFENTTAATEATTEPTDTTTEPTDTTTEPIGTTTAEPIGTTTAEPIGTTTAEPIGTTTEPIDTTIEPIDTTTEPTDAKPVDRTSATTGDKADNEKSCGSVNLAAVALLSFIATAGLIIIKKVR